MKRKIAFFVIAVLLTLAAGSLIGTLLLRDEGGAGGISHGAGKGNGTASSGFQSASFDASIIAVIAFAGAIGIVAYYALLPEMPHSRVTQPANHAEKENKKVSDPAQKPVSYVSDKFSDFLDPEEKKVCDVLRAGGGTMLQKEISWKAGYSKVKTHRVVYRLAKRGLVEVEEYFNTNKVRLKTESPNGDAPETRVSAPNLEEKEDISLNPGH